MKKDKVLSYILGGFFSLILLGIFTAEVFNITKSKFGEGLLSSIINLIAIIFCLIYIFYGYKKNAALYYKLFMFVFGVSIISRTTLDCMMFQGPISIAYIVLLALSYGALCALTFAQDLGKKKTFIIGISLLVLQIAFLITYFAVNRSEIDAGNLTVSCNTLRSLTHVGLSLFTNIMIFEKYKDKAARNSK